MTQHAPPKPVLFGRSSSHFTRVARIFAAELGVDCDFEIVRDLLSLDASDYGENPALKMPALRTSRGAWFGSLPICRELARLSSKDARIVWPEFLETPLLANAQELVVQAMATEVTLILTGLGGAKDESPHRGKLRTSLVGSLAWLEDHAHEVLAALPPERDLSYLEVTLYCLVAHLAFRDVVPLAPYPALNDFRARFEARASVNGTTFRFDA